MAIKSWLSDIRWVSFLALSLLASLNVSLSWADDVDEMGGTLNPMEMAIYDAPGKKASMGVCMAGYLLNKNGSHAEAFATHKKCASAGYTRSMIWLAYIYQNGLIGGEESPELAAYWDRRGAEAGNEIAMHNHGLNLLRGYGVERNPEEGKHWIRLAAELEHNHSLELIAADFDLSVVTPDADEPRWQSLQ